MATTVVTGTVAGSHAGDGEGTAEAGVVDEIGTFYLHIEVKGFQPCYGIHCYKTICSESGEPVTVTLLATPIPPAACADVIGPWDPFVDLLLQSFCTLYKNGEAYSTGICDEKIIPAPEGGNE